jgi:hypothetical protein
MKNRKHTCKLGKPSAKYSPVEGLNNSILRLARKGEMTFPQGGGGGVAFMTTMRSQNKKILWPVYLDTVRIGLVGLG